MAITARRLVGALVCCLSLAAAGALAPAPAAAQATPEGRPVPAPSAAANVAPCASSDLGVRELTTTTEGDQRVGGTYVLQNRGSAPCRIVGAVGIRLLDAQGNSMPLHFAVRTAMAMLLTLAPGGEASFTVSYAAPVTARCAAADRIAVYISPQPTPVAAPATIAACTGPLVRVSNLTAGAPRMLSPC